MVDSFEVNAIRAPGIARIYIVIISLSITSPLNR